ncbi:MAG: murein hydrolase activator EnvC family protein, partial [Beijerinckiaceae bacterium]
MTNHRPDILQTARPCAHAVVCEFVRAVVLWAALALLASSTTVHAQTAPATRQEAPSAAQPSLRGTDAPPEVVRQAAERARHKAELESIEKSIQDNAQLRQKLDGEVEAVRADRGRLNTSLIETADKLRATEQRMGAIELRLAALEKNERAIRESLSARRDLIAEVLAALQRMGRKPPPAIFVRPDDILASVRAAIALGAVMPELRAETQTLANDLAALVRL